MNHRSLDPRARSTLVTLFAGTALLFVTACPSAEKAPPSAAAPSAGVAQIAPPKEASPPAAAKSALGTEPSAEDHKAAVEIFTMRCVPCHGALGAGDGPASAALTPKPASFRSPEWQAKVTDEHIEKIIQYGGSAVGKSAAMPPNPDLVDKLNVVRALRAHLRGLKQAG